MIYSMSVGGRWLLFILHLFFWIVVVLGVVALIKFIIQPGQREKDKALEILRRRYASGEISHKEFEEKKKNLLK